MSTNNSHPNFLVQITLLKSSNPPVSRLLSVPPDVVFSGLHIAIVASFGWRQEEYRTVESSQPFFRVVRGEPFKTVRHELMEISYAIIGDVAHWQNEDYDIGDLDLVKVHEVFRHFGYRESFLIYNHGDGFFHIAIKVLGKSIDSTNREITCVGGQGFTTQKLWNQNRREMERTTMGGPSSWDVNMDEVRLRLRRVEMVRLASLAGVEILRLELLIASEQKTMEITAKAALRKRIWENIRRHQADLSRMQAAKTPGGHLETGCQRPHDCPE